MLRSFYAEARRLTDDLRASASRGNRYDRAADLDEREATLQIVLEGGVLRQRFLPDGKRQTVAVYFRDDVVNLTGYVGAPTRRSDYLLALEGTVIGEVPDATFRDIRAKEWTHDGLAVLLLHELSISHERIGSLGQRSAIERTAHFLCEALIRCSDPSDPGPPDGCPLGLTQDLLSSITGITPVHANRTLQELRRRDLADLVDGRLIVHDFDRLAALGRFDDGYLIRF